MTKAVEQCILQYQHITVEEKITPFHVVLRSVFEEKGTNNLISLYTNRTGCPCIGSLFMKKYMNTLVTCSDCVNML